MTVERLRDDANVSDPRLLYRIHDGREGPEGHVLVRSDKNRLVLRIANLLPQLGCNLIDVDGIVPQKDALLLVHADDQPLLGNFFDRARLGDAHLDPRLQHRRRHHENNQQHQNHVHQRRNVDVSDRRLGAPIGSREGHYLRTSGTAGCERSTAFNISSAKSSPRAANSRMELPSKLYPITAGIAAANPAAVVIKASEIPGATARSVAAPAVPNPWNASIMPQTVPNNPMKGVTEPVMASHGTLRSRRVISSEQAICMARCIAILL